MRVADFEFELPEGLIAQVPASRRDASRLLVLDRESNSLAHRQFRDFPTFLSPGDLLVLNNSRVISARLRGCNVRGGGQFELLLLRENLPNDWWAMMRPGKRARPGTRISLRTPGGEPTAIEAAVIEQNKEGHRRVRFSGCANILENLDEIGEVPLPPYIHRATGPSQPEDRERYQTVYARTPGSVAAPTAGLHFSPEMLGKIRELGARIAFVTLHVGLGTFAPVKAEEVRDHPMHEEVFHVPDETAALVNEARRDGRRIIAVGTTTVRVLEHLGARDGGRVTPGAGATRIFIHPPWTFRVVDALLTNFHLPRSTLLMLVSAFAAPGRAEGRERALTAYAEAVREKYRFFSYGDAMLLR